LLYRHSQKKTTYLNETAAAVWQLCDGRRTVREVIDTLADAYPEMRDAVVADVNEAIDTLFRAGVLRLEASGGNGGQA